MTGLALAIGLGVGSRFALDRWAIAGAILLLAFISYALIDPPSRYRAFGPDQARQAMDHKHGRFGGSYADYPAGHTTRAKVRRNDPCPCGSGRKYKRCCSGV
jgi:hypothetical protein